MISVFILDISIVMNYYQITSGIDDDESDAETDNHWEMSGRSRDHHQHQHHHHHQLHNAVQNCLSQSTVEDLMSELSRNTREEDNNNSVGKTKSPVAEASPDSPVSSSGVLMRRPTSGRSSYSHRASQRFSRLLEGVSSLVTMTGMRTEDSQTESPSGPDTPDNGPASLPYWVEASQIISKVSW